MRVPPKPSSAGANDGVMLTVASYFTVSTASLLIEGYPNPRSPLHASTKAAVDRIIPRAGEP